LRPNIETHAAAHDGAGSALGIERRERDVSRSRSLLLPDQVAVAHLRHA
jgi:hypothetical protein